MASLSVMARQDLDELRPGLVDLLLLTGDLPLEADHFSRGADVLQDAPQVLRSYGSGARPCGPSRGKSAPARRRCCVTCGGTWTGRVTSMTARTSGRLGSASGSRKHSAPRACEEPSRRGDPRPRSNVHGWPTVIRVASRHAAGRRRRRRRAASPAFPAHPARPRGQAHATGLARPVARGSGAVNGAGQALAAACPALRPPRRSWACDPVHCAATARRPR